MVPRLPGSLTESSAMIRSPGSSDFWETGFETTPIIPCEVSVSVSFLNDFSGSGSTMVLVLEIFSRIAGWPRRSRSFLSIM